LIPAFALYVFLGPFLLFFLIFLVGFVGVELLGDLAGALGVFGLILFGLFGGPLVILLGWWRWTVFTEVAGSRLRVHLFPFRTSEYPLDDVRSVTVTEADSKLASRAETVGVNGSLLARLGNDTGGTHEVVVDRSPGPRWRVGTNRAAARAAAIGRETGVEVDRDDATATAAAATTDDRALDHRYRRRRRDDHRRRVRDRRDRRSRDRDR
jgi:hypothetical protein